jgi:hypothetical protein
VKKGRASKVRTESDSESDDYDDEDDDDLEEDSELGNEEGSSDEEDEDEDGENQVNFKNLFKYLLPTFLFKWNGDIDLEPDMADVKSYCQANGDLSYLLGNFKKIAKAVNDVDMD